jgi:hypothetical protein
MKKAASRSRTRHPWPQTRKPQPQAAATAEQLAPAATAHRFQQAERFALDYNGLDADDKALVHEVARRLRATNLRAPKTRYAEKTSASSGMSFPFYELLAHCSGTQKYILAQIVWAWRGTADREPPPAGYYPDEHVRAKKAWDLQPDYEPPARGSRRGRQ